jgi:alkylation response protein AidB-like acyl-CoA dehydrogenase
MNRTDAASDSTEDFAIYLKRAHALVPLIESEAPEGERTGTLTDKVVVALRESGFPWMMVPKGAGGGGLRISECIEVNELITAADASTGWVLQAYMFAAWMHAGFLPPSGAERLFGDGSPKILAGSLAPPGRATRVDGGLKINGLWNFGSGAKHADYVGGGVLVHDEAGNLITEADGSPEFRLAFVPRDQVSLQGNWAVSGLVGTDSQDYAVKDVLVPEDQTVLATPSAKPYRPEGSYLMGLLNIAVAGHAAIALGLMRRALREVALLTEGKQRLGYPVPVDEHPLFLSEFAKHEVLYQTSRAYILESFRAAEASAENEGSVAEELISRVRQASTHAHDVAEDVVRFTRYWAGTKGFREPSAISRVARDLAVAVTHLQVDPITYIAAAPALLSFWKTN